MPNADEALFHLQGFEAWRVERRMKGSMRLEAFAAGFLSMLGPAAGCGDDAVPAEALAQGVGGAEPALDRGDPVVPPFAVRGELEGLLLVWFDAEGPHTAERRSDIPDERRAHVRVDSLRIAPERRLDPDRVYVADLRRAGPSGDYPVREVARDDFDAAVDSAAGAARVGEERAAAPSSDADVIIYGADWCGVCRTAARFFRSRGIAFVEKNIERDPVALREMQEKARRAGVRPSGIPVIDFRGTILTGFDRQRVEALITANDGPT